jgi:hypothetical protein
MKAAVEFPDEGCRARVVALAHKKELGKRLLKLCRTIGAHQPDVLSNQLLMLIEGAYSTAGILEKRDVVKAVAKGGRSPDRCRDRLIVVGRPQFNEAD